MKKQLITILVPVFNEEVVLISFYNSMIKVINKIDRYDFEILFIDDGSTDSSIDIIKRLKEMDDRIGFVSLSRNYGKEIAMVAGFDYLRGEAAVIIDADLQDPPELIPQFIEKWEEGYDDVYAKRLSRKGETYVKKITSRYFYKILSRMSSVSVLEDTGDFRLLSGKALGSIRQIRESERYTKGLFSLIGHRKYCVQFHRAPRAAGVTKWSFFKLINLAIQGITSFSAAPLKLTTILGFIFATIAFIYMIVIVLKTILFGEPVQGYPSLVSIILFLGGVQMISLGIIGEYLGKVFMETKGRPLYFVQEYDSGVKNENITSASDRDQEKITPIL